MIKQLFIQLLVGFSLLSSVAAKEYDFVVATDGSGDFTSIQDAVEACRAFQTNEKIIFIKNGGYNEKVIIQHFRTHITLIGESADSTILEWSDYAGMEGIGTFNSYTLKVEGDDVKIRNLTIQNGSGPVGQAVALHIEGDRCVVSNCKLLGHQDTLYIAGEKNRHLFMQCLIAGTTDFIFGGATAYFEECEIKSLKDSYITAASTLKGKRYGFVFYKCNLTAEDDVSKVYLGRPWRPFAQTVFIKCQLGKHIRSEGWHNWGNEANEKTAFYAELECKGKGAEISNRVKWSRQLPHNSTAFYAKDSVLAPIVMASENGEWYY